MAELSEEQIFKYKKELEYFYKQRRTFLIIGLVLLGCSLLLFIIAMALLAGGESGMIISIILIYPIVFLVVGGVIMFILRSALYNARINNRKLALEIDEYQKQKTNKEQ